MQYECWFAFVRIQLPVIFNTGSKFIIILLLNFNNSSIYKSIISVVADFLIDGFIDTKKRFYDILYLACRIAF